MTAFVHDYADWASWLGLLVSILGMILTVFTLVTAQNIKSRLMRRFQLPQMLKDVEDGLKELNRLLASSTVNSQELRIHIRAC